ncbi:MAG TPA: hypothetical protein VFL91_05125 [Thermomicrobiales bacterium]|nr:hypothetical protein [Thermomicrobiales bacterium]
MLSAIRARGRILGAVLGLPGVRCAGCGDPEPGYVCPACRELFCNHCIRAGHRHAATSAGAAGPDRPGRRSPGAAPVRRATSRGEL